MTDTTETFLAQLQRDIWRYHPPTTPRGVGYNEVVRKLTEQEWERIQTLIREEHILCMMANSDFGFGLAMYLFKCPIYPGPSPEWVLRVAARHLPWWDDDNHKTSPKSRWDQSWDAFSPFTHSEENARVLKFFGMEAPQSKGHYDY